MRDVHIEMLVFPHLDYYIFVFYESTACLLFRLADCNLFLMHVHVLYSAVIVRPPCRLSFEAFGGSVSLKEYTTVLPLLFIVVDHI